MAKVAVIQKNLAKDLLNRDLVGEYDLYGLVDDPSIKKVLKRDVTIQVDTDAYDWVILVGSEALQYFTKQKSVNDFCGKVVEGKFLPILNPAMISFKPEAEKPYRQAMNYFNELILGSIQYEDIDYRDYARLIKEPEEIKEYLKAAIAHPKDVFGLDSETTALYPRDGYMLGISICYDGETGAYIILDEFDEECEALLQELVDKKTPILHNAKFDIKFMQYHLGLVFPELVHDTMLLHYTLDERQGTHGLKQLAVKFTKFGDYEDELYDFIDKYKKRYNLLKSDFSWEFIPPEVMYTYASIDAVVTLQLFERFYPLVQANKKLLAVYEHDLLLPGMRMLVDIEENGVPMDKDRLTECDNAIQAILRKEYAKLRGFDEVRRFEETQGVPFNPGSTQQLRRLLFDFIGLKPTGIKTDSGQHSTNAEVLEILAEEHEVPKIILEIRKFGKIKNTYIDKILPEIDADGCLRTNFNLHTTTSGRLSSSGKLNLQTLPRDIPLIKGAVKAREGYVIVAMDLKTAEVYGAAVLSGDTVLQNVFLSGEDFHSTMAKLVFDLPCEISEVKDLYPSERQQAKAVTFGILYGAGAPRVSEEVTKASGVFFSKSEAQEVIDAYFARFKKLAKWLKDKEEEAKRQGYLYSAFGRKRRLTNIKSSDRATQAKEVRSGLNFLVQSVASDINLMAAIEVQKYIRAQNKGSRVLALVHDSVIAEVPHDEVEWYVKTLTEAVERDRGLSIPGCPPGTDFDISEDYALGKYEKYVNEVFAEAA